MAFNGMLANSSEVVAYRARATDSGQASLVAAKPSLTLHELSSPSAVSPSPSLL
jgi:hypothetical protein